MISDLALASHSIPSFTLTSKALLSPFLDSHPPSAIITDAEFLPHLLELIYDIHEKVVTKKTKAIELSLEDRAFLFFLKERTVEMDDGQVYLKLFLHLVTVTDGISGPQIMSSDGWEYFRLSCLSNSL